MSPTTPQLLSVADVQAGMRIKGANPLPGILCSSGDVQTGALAEGVAAGGAASTLNCKRSDTSPTPSLFGAEVVGRRLRLCAGPKGSTSIDRTATVASFDAASGQHQLLFQQQSSSADAPPPSGSSLTDAEWVSLSAVRFEWTSDPTEHAQPNPSYSGSPKAEAAVGQRVRVYLPSSRRWSAGVVRSYHPQTDTHKVEFDDGQGGEYRLKHEAVSWVSTEEGERRNAGPADGTSAQQQPQQSQGQSAPAQGPAAGAGPAASQGAAVVSGSQGAQGAGANGQHGCTNGVGGGQQPYAAHRTSTAGVGTPGPSLPPAKRSRRSGDAPASPPGIGAASASLTAGQGPMQPGPAAPGTEPSLVGARVGVWWDGDQEFYLGRFTARDPRVFGRYQMRYDDGEVEWLQLHGERLHWLMPRGCTAGYTPEVHSLLGRLGCVPGLLSDAAAAGPPREGPPRLLVGGVEALAGEPPRSLGNEAVGRRISLYWRGTGTWYPAEILAYNSRSGRHHVLYSDGEDEWVELRGEAVAWWAPEAGAGGRRAGQQAQGQVQQPPLPPVAVGIIAGQPVPQGQAAVGWRVSVYWRGDQTFYDGRIVSYNSSNGQHTILYDDEEVGQLVLTAEKLIWRQPPTDNPKRDAAAAAATRDAIAAAGGFATAAGPGDVMLYDDDDPFMSDSDEPEEEDDSDDSDDGRGGNKRKGGAAAAGKKRKKGPAAAAAGGPQKKQKGGAKRPGQEGGPGRKGPRRSVERNPPPAAPQSRPPQQHQQLQQPLYPQQPYDAHPQYGGNDPSYGHQQLQYGKPGSALPPPSGSVGPNGFTTRTALEVYGGATTVDGYANHHHNHQHQQGLQSGAGGEVEVDVVAVGNSLAPSPEGTYGAGPYGPGAAGPANSPGAPAAPSRASAAPAHPFHPSSSRQLLAGPASVPVRPVHIAPAYSAAAPAPAPAPAPTASSVPQPAPVGAQATAGQLQQLPPLPPPQQQQQQQQAVEAGNDPVAAGGAAWSSLASCSLGTRPAEEDAVAQQLLARLQRRAHVLQLFSNRLAVAEAAMGLAPLPPPEVFQSIGLSLGPQPRQPPQPAAAPGGRVMLSAVAARRSSGGGRQLLPLPPLSPADASVLMPPPSTTPSAARAAAAAAAAAAANGGAAGVGGGGGAAGVTSPRLPPVAMASAGAVSPRVQ